MSDSRYLWIAGLIFLILISGPYLYGHFSVAGDFLFNGFLLNPIDGNSYLAKIQLGRDGHWKFSLPYTAENSPGAYLYLFYVLLGHIGRILNVDNLFIFHTARLGSSLVLIFSLEFYFRKVISNQRARKWAFVIALFGSGLGWLGIIFNYFSSDFWVAEIYPFLSAYANPHFPLGLGLLLILITPQGVDNPYFRFIGGLLLAIVQPFAAVLAIVITGFDFVFHAVRYRDKQTWKIWKFDGFNSVLSLALGGGLFVVYQYLMIINDPLLSLWNEQNKTPSPEPIDLILSLSPIVLVSFFGIRKAWQRTEASTLLIWAAAGLCLSVLPWPLQRRFLTGLFVPLAGLAGLAFFTGRYQLLVRNQVISLLILLVSLPTNLVILISGLQAINQTNQAVVYPAELGEVFSWIEDNTKSSEIVLANKRIGNLIPAYTGRRVLFGHPFETVNSEKMEIVVEEFFSEGIDPSRKIEIISNWDVNYILAEGKINLSSLNARFPQVKMKMELENYSIYEVTSSGEND